LKKREKYRRAPRSLSSFAERKRNGDGGDAWGVRTELARGGGKRCWLWPEGKLVRQSWVNETQRGGIKERKLNPLKSKGKK